MIRYARREASRSSRNEAGFTLLELLVAMAVLSLLSLVMMGGLKFGARVWERAQGTSDESDAVTTAEAFIRHQLVAAYPQWHDTGPDKPHILFAGDQHGVTFLAPRPEQFGTGTDLQFALLRSSAGDLDVTWQPQEAGALPTHTVLLRNISAVEFSYYGPPPGGNVPKWFDSWSNRARLPDLIRIRVAFQPKDRRVWPELVVHPDITVDVRCIYEPLTRTCRGRPE
jgi:general secretion pathway protein J